MTKPENESCDCLHCSNRAFVELGDKMGAWVNTITRLRNVAADLSELISLQQEHEVNNFDALVHIAEFTMKVEASVTVLSKRVKLVAH